MGKDFDYFIVPNMDPRSYDELGHGGVGVEYLRNSWEGPVSDWDEDLKYIPITRQELFQWIQTYMIEKKIISINGWTREYDGVYDAFIIVGNILAQMRDGECVIITYN